MVLSLLLRLKYFHADGVFLIQVRLLGGNQVLLTFDSVEIVETFLTVQIDWLKQWFMDLKPWEPVYKSAKRLVWVKFNGVHYIGFPRTFHKVISVDVHCTRYDVVAIEESVGLLAGPPRGQEDQISCSPLNDDALCTKLLLLSTILATQVDMSTQPNDNQNLEGQLLVEEQLVECNHAKERSCAILESDGLEIIFLNRPKPPLDQADQPFLLMFPRPHF
ncbi:hypothetical protein GH714_030835 [Hevea brasiliensis]|uniref:DUF4283 domain-containing protein n=1 Tax=Hevea brasiliensis TaxID=3981 RepID=A0A6A6LN59_HEVBR|nr:hypothetical protein GH714_030835 [Hevea brasiliensis]